MKLETYTREFYIRTKNASEAFAKRKQILEDSENNFKNIGVPEERIIAFVNKNENIPTEMYIKEKRQEVIELIVNEVTKYRAPIMAREDATVFRVKIEIEPILINTLNDEGAGS